MNELNEQSISCPYCGETLVILIDSSVAQQNYIEDCQVCCRPITVDVTVNLEGEPSVEVFHEDD